MSDRNCVGEAMIEMQMKWLFVNEEYQMLICTRKLCGIGMELGGVEKHLIKRHEVKKTLARGVQMAIRAAQEGKGWEEYSTRRPRNGLRPQRGLAVFDGFQCGLCDELPARRVEDVEHHLYVFPGKKECHIWYPVRMQSWGGKGRVSDVFWIVDESKEDNDEGYLDDEGWREGGGREESEEGQGFDDLQQWVGEEPSTWELREVGGVCESRVAGRFPSNVNICKTRERTKQAQAKMSDSKNSAAGEMPAGVKNLIVVNPEYEKIICRAKGCGRAIKAVNLRKHLQGRHRIGTSVARQASQVARGLKWDEEGWRNVKPEDGLAPQVGIAAWYGNFSDGYYHRYWVVAGGMPSEWEEAAPAEEAPVEEAGQVEKAPAAELNKKEIPDYISEESEVWSEEDGQEEREREGCKEKEKFDEWEGLCFG
ncbi:hypothetical protein O988_05247 [Pseudogymnoascus sp. VKM F-3808]|nr:hypothetical protein O988_05247 [Pseudogymnoascus sp. VKM F-3808]